MTFSYDAGAAAYDRLTGRWSRLYVPALVSAAAVAHGHAVLDVAAGTGKSTVGLASHVGSAGQVLVVDLPPAMLRVAADKTAGRPVRFAVMDGLLPSRRQAVRAEAERGMAQYNSGPTGA